MMTFKLNFEKLFTRLLRAWERFDNLISTSGIHTKKLNAIKI